MSIKGITVDISANTVRFDRSVDTSQEKMKLLRAEARETNAALKLDPDSIEHVSKSLVIAREKAKLTQEKMKDLAQSMDKLDANKAKKAKQEFARLGREIDKETNFIKKMDKRLHELGDNKSLYNLKKQSTALASKLRIVDKELRLDPSRVDLTKEKMELLKKQTALTEDKVEALKKEISQTKNPRAIEALNLELREAQYESTKARKDIERFSETLDATKQDAKELDAAFEKTMDTLRQKPHSMDEFNHQMKMAKDVTESLRTKIMTLTAEYDQLEDTSTTVARSMKNDIERYQESLSQVDSSVSYLMGTMHSLEKTSENVFDELITDSKTLNRELNKLQNEFKLDSADFDKARAYADKLHEKLSQTTSQVSLLEAKLDTVDDSMKDDLLDQIEKLENGIIRDRQELLKLGDAAKLVSSEMDSMSIFTSRSIKKIGSSVRDLTNDFAEATNDLSLGKKFKEDAQKTLQALKIEMLKISREIESASPKSDTSKAQAQLAQLSSAYANVENKLQIVRNSSLEMTREIESNAKKEVEALKKVSNSLDERNNKLSEYDSTGDEFTNEIKKSNEELERSQRLLQKLNHLQKTTDNIQKVKEYAELAEDVNNAMVALDKHVLSVGKKSDNSGKALKAMLRGGDQSALGLKHRLEHLNAQLEKKPKSVGIQYELAKTNNLIKHGLTQELAELEGKMKSATNAADFKRLSSQAADLRLEIGRVDKNTAALSSGFARSMGSMKSSMMLFKRGAVESLKSSKATQTMSVATQATASNAKVMSMRFLGMAPAVQKIASLLLLILAPLKAGIFLMARFGSMATPAGLAINGLMLVMGLFRSSIMKSVLSMALLGPAGRAAFMVINVAVKSFSKVASGAFAGLKVAGSSIFGFLRSGGMNAFMMMSLAAKLFTAGVSKSFSALKSIASTSFAGVSRVISGSFKVLGTIGSLAAKSVGAVGSTLVSGFRRVGSLAGKALTTTMGIALKTGLAALAVIALRAILRPKLTLNTSKALSSFRDFSERVRSSNPVTNLTVMGLDRARDGLAEVARDATAAYDSVSTLSNSMKFSGFDKKTIEESGKALSKYAAQTSYDIEEIMTLGGQLASDGTKDFIGMTKAIGNLNNVTGGTKTSFGSLSKVVSQTNAVGKLTYENWAQMRDALPGAASAMKGALKEVSGITKFDFNEALKKGMYTAEDFSAAIRKLGESEAAIAAASNVTTYAAGFDNLKASAADAMVEILEVFGNQKIIDFMMSFEKHLQSAKKILLNVASWIKSNSDWMVPMIENVAKFTAVLSGLSLALSGIAGIMTVLASPGLMILGIAAALAKMYLSTQKGQDAIKKFIDWIKNNARPLLEEFGRKFNELILSIKPIVEAVFKTLLKYGPKTLSSLKPVFIALFEGLTQIRNALMQVIGIKTSEGTLSTIDQLGSKISQFVGFVAPLIAKAITLITSLLSNIIIQAKPAFEFISGFFKNKFNLNSLFTLGNSNKNDAMNLMSSGLTVFIETMKNGLSHAKSAYLDPLLNGFRNIGGIFDVMVSAFNRVKDSFKTLLKDTLEPLVLGIVNALDGIIQGLSSILSEAINAVVVTFTELYKTIEKLITPIIAIIMSIINPVIQIFSKYSSLIKELFIYLGEEFKRLMAYLGPILGPLLKDTERLLLGILNPIKDFFKAIQPQLKAFLDSFIKVMIPVLKSLWGLLKATAKVLFESLVGALRVVVNLLTKFVVPWFKILIKILVPIVKIFFKLAKLILETVGPALKFIMDIFKSLVKTIGKFSKKMFDITNDLLTAESAFGSFFKSIKKLASGFGKFIIDNVIKPLGRLFGFGNEADAAEVMPSQSKKSNKKDAQSKKSKAKKKSETSFIDNILGNAHSAMKNFFENLPEMIFTLFKNAFKILISGIGSFYKIISKVMKLLMDKVFEKLQDIKKIPGKIMGSVTASFKALSKSKVAKSLTKSLKKTLKSSQRSLKRTVSGFNEFLSGGIFRSAEGTKKKVEDTLSSLYDKFKPNHKAKDTARKNSESIKDASVKGVKGVADVMVREFNGLPDKLMSAFDGFNTRFGSFIEKFLVQDLTAKFSNWGSTFENYMKTLGDTVGYNLLNYIDKSASGVLERYSNVISEVKTLIQNVFNGLLTSLTGELNNTIDNLNSSMQRMYNKAIEIEAAQDGYYGSGFMEKIGSFEKVFRNSLRSMNVSMPIQSINPYANDASYVNPGYQHNQIFGKAFNDILDRAMSTMSTSPSQTNLSINVTANSTDANHLASVIERKLVRSLSTR